MNERSSSRGHTAHGSTRDGQQSRDASDGRDAPASTSRRKFLGQAAAFEAVPLGCNPVCAVPLDTSTISDDESRLAPPDPTRTKQRRLVSPQAGYNFDLEGKDYQQLINRDTPLLPPVPIAFPAALPFASPSEVVEIIENYWQALTRDVPFINYNSDLLVQAAAADLNKPQIKQYYVA